MQPREPRAEVSPNSESTLRTGERWFIEGTAGRGAAACRAGLVCAQCHQHKVCLPTATTCRAGEAAQSGETPGRKETSWGSGPQSDATTLPRVMPPGNPIPATPPSCWVVTEPVPGGTKEPPALSLAPAHPGGPRPCGASLCRGSPWGPEAPGPGSHGNPARMGVAMVTGGTASGAASGEGCSRWDARQGRVPTGLAWGGRGVTPWVWGSGSPPCPTGCPWHRITLGAGGFGGPKAGLGGCVGAGSREGVRGERREATSQLGVTFARR